MCAGRSDFRAFRGAGVLPPRTSARAEVFRRAKDGRAPVAVQSLQRVRTAGSFPAPTPRPVLPSLRSRMKLRPLAAAILLAAASHRPAATQDTLPPATHSGRVLWAGAGALFAGSVLLDRTIAAEIPNGGGTRWRWLSRPFNRGGRQTYALAGLVATDLSARVAGAPKVYHAAEHAGIALLVAGAANGTLKYAVGRERPRFTDDPHRFRPFNSKDRWQSFPSGHAVIAFSLAASISEEARRPWVTALTYGTASLVGWSRVYDDRHWTSDVVGGAIVSVAASRWTIHRLHERAARRDSASAGVSITPLPGGVMVSITR
jgi:membrane-associated phospholipid phosphatase